jgi:Tfp pilus assembly protein FimT
MNRTPFSTTRLLKVLVFVFVTLVIVAEMPCPSLRLSRTKRIDEATDILCGQILLTRQKAIASGTRYRIQYDFVTGTCTTYREASSGLWLPEDGYEERVPRRVVISPTSTPINGHIEIGTDGTIENYGLPVVIRLTDDEGTQKSIRISPAGMAQEIPTW